MINPSPLQEIFPPSGVNLRVFLKRDELLHPEIQGNKWRKLAPFIQEMGEEKKGVLSFGGAFSNHLHALAKAGSIFKFPTIGILRGTSVDLGNPTLTFAQKCGMQLFRVSKADYERLKKAELPEIFQFIGISPTEPYLLLPEGGDTIEALVACSTIVVEIMAQLPANMGSPLYFCIPAGTGCTAAGVIAGLGQQGRVLVFPAAPYGVDRASILSKLAAANCLQEHDFQIVDHILPKKFAQMTPELLAFVQTFHQDHRILLDPVYTSKMMFKVYEMFAQQFFPPGSCVVALHTGGLQGWLSHSDAPG